MSPPKERQQTAAATCAECGGVFQVTAERPHQSICQCGMPSASDKERAAVLTEIYTTEDEDV